jgi:nucleoside-diphosphate-sugar epimerase
VLGTRNVIDVALQKHAGKLVHTSSVSVFFPNMTATIDEAHPHNGLTHWASYGNTKALAELEVRAGIADGLWAVILNPAAIIGLALCIQCDPGKISFSAFTFGRKV